MKTNPRRVAVGRRVRKNIVFFTGAGMSAESGLPTFRGPGGIWDTIDPFKVASARAWNSRRYRGYIDRRQAILDFFNPIRRAIIDREPNRGHFLIVDFERYFDVTVITQNGDDFHTRAGSTNVLYLHGQALFNTSSANPYNPLPIDRDNPDIHIGDRAPDGSQLRPYVTFFDENIDRKIWLKAAEATRNADIFVVIGSSLKVFPAASLLSMIRPDCKLYIIDPNRLETYTHLPVEKYTRILAKASFGLMYIAAKLGVEPTC